MRPDLSVPCIAPRVCMRLFARALSVRGPALSRGFRSVSPRVQSPEAQGRNVGLDIVIGTVSSSATPSNAAIRDYWKDVPYHQSEITFTAGEIFAAASWFSTEFRVVYRRRRTGEWVDARGAIFCETEDGKVSEMRMYWIRK